MMNDSKLIFGFIGFMFCLLLLLALRSLLNNLTGRDYEEVSQEEVLVMVCCCCAIVHV